MGMCVLLDTLLVSGDSVL